MAHEVSAIWHVCAALGAQDLGDLLSGTPSTLCVGPGQPPTLTTDACLPHS
jgi:hypothetical protein